MEADANRIPDDNDTRKALDANGLEGAKVESFWNFKQIHASL